MGRRRIAAVAALVSLAVGSAAPAHAQATSGPGKGTATSSVTGAKVTLATVAVELATMSSRATLDKEKRNEALNLVEGALTAAGVKIGGIATSLPLESLRVSRDEANTGEDARRENLAVSFAVPGDVSASAAGASATTSSLLTDVEGAPSTNLPNGLIAEGSARPLNLVATFGGSGAEFSGGSTVESIGAVGGLAKVQRLTVSDEETQAQPDLSRGAIRELGVDSMTVLDMNSLLGLLGLDKGEISVTTLAKMADELKVAVTGTLGSKPVSDYGSWLSAAQTLSSAEAQLEAQVGGACAALPGDLVGLLGQTGVACSGTVQQALDTVNGLLSDLLGLVEPAVFDGPLVSANGLTASVNAVAGVTPDGVAETSAGAVGTIRELRVGGVGCGSVSADLTTRTLSSLQVDWNKVRDVCNALLDDVLGALGDAYRSLVDVVPAPVKVQTTRVEGDYAVANASLTLLQVKVTLPAVLPAPLDLATTTTTTSTTSPLPLPTTTTIALPPLPPLPISSVRPASDQPLATTATIDVGVLSAHAEHTRPGVDITSGGQNRTWNSRTGFGGPLPETGAGSGTWPLAVFAVLMTAAFAANRLARSRVRSYQGH